MLYPDTVLFFFQDNQGGGLWLGQGWEVSVCTFNLWLNPLKTAWPSILVPNICCLCFFPVTGASPLVSSHDFIGDYTTSYRELARGQSQFNVYEVSVPPDSICVISISHHNSTIVGLFVSSAPKKLVYSCFQGFWLITLMVFLSMNLY